MQPALTCSYVSAEDAIAAERPHDDPLPRLRGQRHPRAEVALRPRDGRARRGSDCSFAASALACKAACWGRTNLDYINSSLEEFADRLVQSCKYVTDDDAAWTQRVNEKAQTLKRAFNGWCEKACEHDAEEAPTVRKRGRVESDTQPAAALQLLG